MAQAARHDAACRPKRPQPLTLDHERCHSLLPAQSGRCTDVEVNAVLCHLAFRHLLKEEPRTVPVRILDSPISCCTVPRHADPPQEVVPRGKWVGILREFDSGSICAVDFAAIAYRTPHHQRGSPPSSPTGFFSEQASSCRLPALHRVHEISCVLPLNRLVEHSKSSSASTVRSESVTRQRWIVTH